MSGHDWLIDELRLRRDGLNRKVDFCEDKIKALVGALIDDWVSAKLDRAMIDRAIQALEADDAYTGPVPQQKGTAAPDDATPFRLFLLEKTGIDPEGKLS